METFRVRDKQVNFRCTENEKERINERYKASGCHDMADYLRTMAMEGYIINVEYKELKALIYEINKIGVNINQIAHKVNQEQILYNQDLEHIQEDIKSIWQMLRSKLIHI